MPIRNKTNIEIEEIINSHVSKYNLTSKHESNEHGVIRPSNVDIYFPDCKKIILLAHSSKSIEAMKNHIEKEHRNNEITLVSSTFSNIDKITGYEDADLLIINHFYSFKTDKCKRYIQKILKSNINIAVYLGLKYKAYAF